MPVKELFFRIVLEKESRIRWKARSVIREILEVAGTFEVEGVFGKGNSGVDGKLSEINVKDVSVSEKEKLGIDVRE